MMIAPRNEIARLQSTFYRDQYHRMLRFLLVNIFFIFALIVTIVYILLHQVPMEYYANTSDGRIMKMPNANQG